MKLRTCFSLLCAGWLTSATAQTFDHYITTDTQRWQQAAAVRTTKGEAADAVTTDTEHPIVTFRRWGTTFNEQDWRALCMLTREQQDEVLRNAFSPDGQLRLGIGRISMNANDYALRWYSCSEVPGDFENLHFNIEHDKLTIIPYIRAAQRFNAGLTFWVSPWSPPAWMKINHHYAVQSSRYSDLDPRLDRLLFRDGDRSINEQVTPDKHL
ncbi:MAG: beta-glycosidase, partial [Bacteroidaceae bacterium]|nr:beta-glycosidase [Bacteroidaceae bacterium]